MRTSQFSLTVTLAAYRLIRTAKSGRKTAVSQGRPQGAVLVEATDANKTRWWWTQPPFGDIGVDGMTVQQLPEYLKQHWPAGLGTEESSTLGQDGDPLDILVLMDAPAHAGWKLFTPIEDDFPALNKPYSKLSEDEWRTLRSIAQERLYALNWLCRYAEDWDAVPTGT